MGHCTMSVDNEMSHLAKLITHTPSRGQHAIPDDRCFQSDLFTVVIFDSSDYST